MLKQRLRESKGFVTRWFFPPHCVGCNYPLQGKERVFCPSCASQIHLIDPKTRCPFCFEEDEGEVCQECFRLERRTLKIAAAFDMQGPLIHFVQGLKYKKLPYLAKVGALYLLALLATLPFPSFDAIVPIPISPLKKWRRGYNQSALLAAPLAKWLHIPMLPLLCRRPFFGAQTGRGKQLRKTLSGEAFSIKKRGLLTKKNILLIDDVLTTGSTLRAAAEKLYEEHPKSIYGLTLARTLR